ncbi:hypothetical protein Rctr85_095 [Virus Rctr85]|nr:hypothetical protein Rctr85_095 [Virus Rctr85]
MPRSILVPVTVLVLFLTVLVGFAYYTASSSQTPEPDLFIDYVEYLPGQSSTFMIGKEDCWSEGGLREIAYHICTLPEPFLFVRASVQEHTITLTTFYLKPGQELVLGQLVSWWGRFQLPSFRSILFTDTYWRDRFIKAQSYSRYWGWSWQYTPVRTITFYDINPSQLGIDAAS